MSNSINNIAGFEDISRTRDVDLYGQLTHLGWTRLTLDSNAVISSAHGPPVSELLYRQAQEIESQLTGSQVPERQAKLMELVDGLRQNVTAEIIHLFSQFPFD